MCSQLQLNIKYLKRCYPDDTVNWKGLHLDQLKHIWNILIGHVLYKTVDIERFLRFSFDMICMILKRWQRSLSLTPHIEKYVKNVWRNQLIYSIKSNIVDVKYYGPTKIRIDSDDHLPPEDKIYIQIEITLIRPILDHINWNNYLSDARLVKWSYNFPSS